ncbi:formate dehydrogenase, alpha subunit [Peptoclostridium litorale DSM 5388]|uniref:Formate dehydrogenase subunit alpha n=3 Tax=Peptoclostridium litorale TaxID=1557 RepID=A0A069RDM2_PEPLI|nr:formate dehydrogenase subunit alpha [Peptoclostridium litorale DSM 5388]SIN94370.1 formate dehydrogenase, alpha subunit [Peptoclostridium litorale DSM 5388]
MTNSIAEIIDADAIFVTGSNTTENHPVIGAKIKQAVRKGARLIVADPRRIELADDADVFLQIRPGSNIALANSMMNVIISENLMDRSYIEERTENYEELCALVEKYTPDEGARICGVSADDIVRAAKIYAGAKKAGIYYAMGITQHTTGTDNVMSLSNLSLLCGNIGIESAGVNPLRGQNNVQGACDMGGLPADLPGYQKVFKPEVIDKFQKAWGAPLSDKVGLTIPEMMHGAGDGSIKMIYIMGENPMVSDPDIKHVKEELENLELLVVQDIFLTETAELADVVLPAASFAEKDGTFTNTERRVQRVRKAVNPVGGSKADWKILNDIMMALGLDKEYESTEEIFDEIASLTPQYGGIDYKRIENEGGLQWPCPTKDHPGTKYLHSASIARGKGLFVPCEYMESAETPDRQYPLIMTTGRVLYHYHTRTMTGKIEGLNQKSPCSYVEINPATANKLGIADGEIVRVVSKRGEIETMAKLTDIVEEEVVFMPFHFANGAANMLTNTELDPKSKIPELKVCAVRIEKV